LKLQNKHKEIQKSNGRGWLVILRFQNRSSKKVTRFCPQKTVSRDDLSGIV